MFSITDGVVLLVLALYLWAGWRRGFLRTLLGPLSVAIATLLAFLYFKQTKNVFVSLAIGLFAPMILGWIFSLVLWFCNRATGQQKPSLLSSSVGAILGLTWGIWILALALLMFSLIPVRMEKIQRIQNDIDRSFSYRLIKTVTRERIPSSEKIQNTANVLQNPKQLEGLDKTAEYQDLIDDPKIKALFSDEETQRQLREKDFAKLLSNPKLLEIVQDPELMKKVLKLNKRLMAIQTNNPSTP